MTTQANAIVSQAQTRIQELHAQGKSSAYIQAVVADELGLSAKGVKSIMATLGLIQGSGAQGDLEALVRTMRENHGKVPREELIDMMAEASGYTKATANHMLSQLNFAKEYHRQMSGK